MKNNVQIIKKPWGSEEIWAMVPGKYIGKFLNVDEGHKLSLQFHKEKFETIYLQAGKVVLTRGVDIVEMLSGDSYDILPGITHRIEAITDSILVEVSTFHPDDVVRLQDEYGRAHKDYKNQTEMKTKGN